VLSECVQAIKPRQVAGEVVGDAVGDAVGEVAGEVVGEFVGEVVGEVIGDVVGEVVGWDGASVGDTSVGEVVKGFRIEVIK